MKLQSKFSPEQYYSTPALTRYFDHIQSRPTVRKAAGSTFSLVEFDIDGMPKIERKPDIPVPKQAAVSSSVATGDAENKKGSSQKKEKKEKKESKDKGQPATSGSAPGKKALEGGGKAAASDDSGEPVPSMIDLRVGHILDGMYACLMEWLRLEMYDLYP